MLKLPRTLLQTKIMERSGVKLEILLFLKAYLLSQRSVSKRVLISIVFSYSIAHLAIKKA